MKINPKYIKSREKMAYFLIGLWLYSWKHFTKLNSISPIIIFPLLLSSSFIYKTSEIIFIFSFMKIEILFFYPF